MEAVQLAPASLGLRGCRPGLRPLRWCQVGAAALTGAHVQVILEGSQGCRALGTGRGAAGAKAERARVALSQTAWVQILPTSCKAQGR